MDLMYVNSKEPRTHEQSRQLVCCCCGRKVKFSKDKKPITVIDEKLSGLIVKYVYSDFSISNSAHPTAICSTCRLTLTAMEKVIFYLFLYFVILIFCSRTQITQEESFHNYWTIII